MPIHSLPWGRHVCIAGCRTDSPGRPRHRSRHQRRVEFGPSRSSVMTDKPRTNLGSCPLSAMVVAHTRFHGDQSIMPQCPGLPAVSSSEMTWAQLGTRQTCHCVDKRQRRGSWETWQDRLSVVSCHCAIGKARLSLRVIHLWLQTWHLRGAG